MAQNYTPLLRLLELNTVMEEQSQDICLTSKDSHLVMESHSEHSFVAPGVAAAGGCNYTPQQQQT